MYNRDPTGEWEYEMPFDLNMKDVTGQNVLYVASCKFRGKLQNGRVAAQISSEGFKNKGKFYFMSIT